MDNIQQNPKPKRGRAGTVFAFFAGLALLVAVGAGAFYWITVRPAVSVGDKVAGVLRQITGGKVSVSTGSAVLEDEEVSELAVVSRRTQCVVKYQSDVMGSENVMIVKGVFDVKAGYKLDDAEHPARLTFDPTTGEVTADFPPAKVLSVEMRKYEVLYAKEGLWNKLTPEDQQYVTQLLVVQARKDAHASDLREEAEMRLATRIEDLLSTPGAAPPPPVLP